MDAGPPEFRALNNDLVLEMIFKNLSTSSLLTYRLVNKKWNKIASDVLKRRRSLYLSISSWTETNFHQLAVLFSKNSFPTTSFKIADMNVIYSLDRFYAKQFFNCFGSIFTSVYLEECKLASDAGMVKLLEEYLPKIEVLTLKHVRLCQGSKWGVERLLMPHLRQIQFDKDLNIDTEIVEPLLAGAPNLEAIYGVPSEDTKILSELRSQNKLGLIASLVMEDTQTGLGPGIYQSLALQPPALTELTLNVPPWINVSKEFDQCALTVLIASQITLQKLTIGRMKIAWENIPGSFSRLHSMELGIYDEYYDYPHYGDGGIVSPGFHNLESADKFPALKKICLVLPPTAWEFELCERRAGPLVTGTNEILQEYFWKPGTVWDTVDTIGLHNHNSPDAIKYLAQVFPNVTQVIMNFSCAGYRSMDADRRKPSDVWYVRKFRSLRKLVIVDFSVGYEKCQLESFLTGIPMSICQDLQKVPKQTLGAPFDRLFRPYGGLWKLRKTGLRELEISYSAFPPPFRYPALSHVAVWYGLEVIPDLRTTFKAPGETKSGFSQALKNLQPHVSVEYF